MSKRQQYIHRIKTLLTEAQSLGTPLKRKKAEALLMIEGASKRLTRDLIQMFIDSERIKEVNVDNEIILIWKLQEAE